MDFLIRQGLLVDGTGAAKRLADVVVEDGNSNSANAARADWM